MTLTIDIRILIIFLTALLVVNCSSTPKPKEYAVQYLDYLGKIHDAQETDWKPEVSRHVFTGQTTGFFARGDLCSLVGRGAFVAMPIQTKYASAKEYRVGTYYDGLRPLTVENCKDAKYAWEDFMQSTEQVELIDIGIIAPYTMPLWVEMNNFQMVRGYCGNYCPEEMRGMQATELLKDHRISVYKNNVKPWNGGDDSNDRFGFFKHSLAFQSGMVWVPNMDGADLGTAHSVLSHRDVWLYTWDEPQSSEMTELITRLTLQKQSAPNFKRMVTTYFKPQLEQLVDIWAPVMDQYGHGFPQDYSGKTLWLYTSCMAHGCGENRAWVQSFTHRDYPRSGVPDLTIDAPSVDVFQFFLVGEAMGAEALLYYNSVEAWPLLSKGIDIWVDPYNFGGNGDGVLIYPDRENKTALPSVRLKLLREASYTFEAIKAAGMMSGLVVDTKQYVRDLSKIQNVRTQAFERLR